jgi:catechol 2,3-dioxygenase-like lactoylglutathione lyase family enzyme
MLDHVSIQCADVATAAAFYEPALLTLGVEKLHHTGELIGYGVDDHSSFWLRPLTDIGPNRPIHLGFVAEDRASVHAFFASAVDTDAEVLHEPTLWPQYGPTYYGALVRDPDGNIIEVVCHHPE